MGWLGVEFGWNVAVVPSALLCGELCLMVGRAAWEMGPKPLSSMWPKQESTSLPILGYFSIPGYKTDWIHLCFWSSTAGQNEKAYLCYWWPEMECEPASPEAKSDVLPQKSQQTAFPIQCVHLCCNLFRERHPQLLSGRWVSLLWSSNVWASLFFKMKELICSLSEYQSTMTQTLVAIPVSLWKAKCFADCLCR